MPDKITDKSAQPEIDIKLASLLDDLANGESVKLGDFEGGAAEASEADILASQLREMALALRESRLNID